MGYICRYCKATDDSYAARCLRCGKFGIVNMDFFYEKCDDEEDENDPEKIVSLSRVKDVPVIKVSTGISGLDRAIGGSQEPGLKIPSCILLGGHAGCGKSTILLQMMASLKVRSLYIAVEEDAETLRQRAKRINLGDRLDRISVWHGKDINKIKEKIIKFRSVVTVIDSISEVEDPLRDTADKWKNRLNYAIQFFDLCHDERFPRVIILISHLNKNQDFEGLQSVQHKVDVVAMIETVGASSVRMLSCPEKNRTGPTGPSTHSYFEMTEDGSGLHQMTREEGESWRNKIKEEEKLKKKEAQQQ